MITSIIFSKDRALQLDLTLKSIKQNFKLCDKVVVIYKASEEQYEESYNNLKTEHPTVRFYKQGGSLFFDIMVNINGCQSDYVCFFTDDNIVYRKVNMSSQQVKYAFDAQGSCISLRMGVNTTQRDYGDGVFRNDNIPQEVFSDPPFIVWNRTTIPTCGYWAYPLSVDGHIFKRETMLEFCVELDVLSRHYDHRGIPREKWSWSQTPNEFESKLQRYYFDLPAPMFALEKSCVVNSPNNRVQSHVENRSGDHFSYAAAELNDLYKSGKRLNVNSINFDNIICPHQEIDILEGLE